LVRACHDLSEGGLAVAAAEMAFAGGLGATIDLNLVPHAADAADPAVLLFSESNTRFLCEVEPGIETEVVFLGLLQQSGIPVAEIGQVTADGHVEFAHGGQSLLKQPITALKEAWQAPLRW
jgi:phosphoribosylformylglycinamidine synthase